MGLPFGFELVERVGLAFVGHDVGRERNREWWEKHAKNTSEIPPFNLSHGTLAQATVNFNLRIESPKKAAKYVSLL